MTRKDVPQPKAEKAGTPSKPSQLAPAEDEDEDDEEIQVRPIGADLDAETLEAIDWWLEVEHPGYLERKAARAHEQVRPESSTRSRKSKKP